jgi:hypothetical protein
MIRIAGADALGGPAVFLKILMQLWANTHKNVCIRP